MGRLSDLERELLRRLDGTQDAPALEAVLAELVARGEVQVTQEGQPVPDVAALRQVLHTAVAQHLSALAQRALLVA